GKERKFNLNGLQEEMIRAGKKLDAIKNVVETLEKKKLYDSRQRLSKEERAEFNKIKAHKVYGRIGGAQLDGAIERGKNKVTELSKGTDRLDELVQLGVDFQRPAAESGAYIELRFFMKIGETELDLARTAKWSTDQ
ncbi:MAG: hypothetical protein N2C12_01490, partial [Planctomycetales bacterium]